jgi:hypothetical protein
LPYTSFNSFVSWSAVLVVSYFGFINSDVAFVYNYFDDVYNYFDYLKLSFLDR